MDKDKKEELYKEAKEKGTGKIEKIEDFKPVFMNAMAARNIEIEFDTGDFFIVTLARLESTRKEVTEMKEGKYPLASSPTWRLMASFVFLSVARGKREKA